MTRIILSRDLLRAQNCASVVVKSKSFSSLAVELPGGNGIMTINLKSQLRFTYTSGKSTPGSLCEDKISNFDQKHRLVDRPKSVKLSIFQ